MATYQFGPSHPLLYNLVDTVHFKLTGQLWLAKLAEMNSVAIASIDDRLALAVTVAMAETRNDLEQVKQISVKYIVRPR